MSLRNKILSAVKIVYPRLGLYDDDVVVASFPKSGSTWLRFIWTNVICLQEMNGVEVGYTLLDGTFEAVYDVNSYGDYKYISVPRLVKTHQKYDKRKFGANRTLYIYRNPGDVMVSFYEYLLSLKKKPINGVDFSDFLRSKKHGIECWCKHFVSWREHATVMLSYESMKASAEKCTINLFEKLDIKDMPKRIISEAVARADFHNVRKIAESEKVYSLKPHWHKAGFRFARKGTVGQWKDYFSSQNKEFLHNLLQSYDLESLFPIEA